MTVKSEMKSEHVALVTLNRPKALNAVNRQMREDLLDALASFSADSNVRAIVITGEGRGFCSGADVTDVGAGRNVEDTLNAEYGAFLSVIRTCEKPVIAAVNGAAAGIGMSIALSCDLKVMSSEAYLMSAFSNIGLVPDGGLSLLLTQAVGYSRAFEAGIEAKKIGAEHCLEWGLVNRVASADDVLDNALGWAEELCARAPVALALTKRAMRAATQDRITNAISFEAMLQRTAIATDDFKEGVSALMEKRKPEFKGR